MPYATTHSDSRIAAPTGSVPKRSKTLRAFSSEMTIATNESSEIVPRISKSSEREQQRECLLTRQGMCRCADVSAVGLHLSSQASTAPLPRAKGAEGLRKSQGVVFMFLQWCEMWRVGTKASSHMIGRESRMARPVACQDCGPARTKGGGLVISRLIGKARGGGLMVWCSRMMRFIETRAPRQHTRAPGRVR